MQTSQRGESRRGSEVPSVESHRYGLREGNAGEDHRRRDGSAQSVKEVKARQVHRPKTVAESAWGRRGRAKA